MKSNVRSSRKPARTRSVAAALGLALLGAACEAPPDEPTSEAAAALSAVKVIQAEAYNASAGVTNYGGGISYCDDGDYVRYDGVDFGISSPPGTFTARVGTANGGGIVEVRLDSLTGKVIATLGLTKNSADWDNLVFTNQTTSLDTVGIYGVHSVYVRFKRGSSTGTRGVGNFDFFRLTPPAKTASSVKLILPSNPAKGGPNQAVYVAAQTFAGGSPTNDGNVTFKLGALTSPPINIASSYSSYGFIGVPPGTYAVSAQYSGSATVAPSQATGTLTVVP